MSDAPGNLDRARGVVWAADYIRLVSKPEPLSTNAKDGPLVLKYARGCRGIYGSDECHILALEGFTTALGFWISSCARGKQVNDQDVLRMVTKWFPL
ncbi:MAG: hypothetical protein KDA51_06625 [Planctomycetales bacterium]|nr:hypothetical protein [Planctomycetales bacterium]